MRVGVILQRAILILLLACFPCWAILINTEPILLAVKQEPEVARSAVSYFSVFLSFTLLSLFFVVFPDDNDKKISFFRLAQLYVKIFMPALPVSFLNFSAC